MDSLIQTASSFFGSRPLLRQVRLDIESPEYHSISKDVFLSSDICAKDDERFQKALTHNCPAEIWPQKCHLACCPRPILNHKHHLKQITDLHEALVLAITDIVKRWWSDKDRRFPERMPVAKEEEDLLMWLEAQVQTGLLRDYSQCQGSWRPDFMIEALPRLGIQENFRITEINARFSFNGFLLGLFGHKALEDMRIEQFGLKVGAWPDKVLKAICGLFDTKHPLHLLQGEELAMDIMMLPFVLDKYCGVKCHFITPSDLRLVPDDGHPTGYRLYCIVTDPTRQRHAADDETEELQEIHQLGLELRQRELAALDAEMLRQISLRCFNDLRTILLVHDKRMLGIVKEELADLKRRGVIDDRQSRILDRGIADSILPGSASIETLLSESKLNSRLKDDYLLKPIRGGKGAGILFGEDVSSEQWLGTLKDLQTPTLDHDITYVIQHRIRPRLYDVLLKGPRPVQNPLVGTWQIINGQYAEPACWRSSSDRICAVSHGGAWIPFVMPLRNHGGQCIVQ